jgi:UDP-hydrolysing UDP-N-acetyl-D-glucosamine 2-epimerase
MKMNENGSVDMLASISKEFFQIRKVFRKERIDYLLALGDRWELLPLVYAAMIMRIPVIHLGGGEDTVGAIDNQIRHAITKLSHIHCVANSVYARHLRAMGEEAWRINIIGSPGLENIRNSTPIDESDVREKLGVPADAEYYLMTYHPETGGNVHRDVSRIRHMMDVLLKRGSHIIATYPNCETGSEAIIDILKRYNRRHKRVLLHENLGTELYLAALKYCTAVVGNSSSGIVEAPFLHRPTINIGSRQQGRLLARSIKWMMLHATLSRQSTGCSTMPHFMLLSVA